jgi:hypothetical protein
MEQHFDFWERKLQQKMRNHGCYGNNDVSKCLLICIKINLIEKVWIFLKIVLMIAHTGKKLLIK